MALKVPNSERKLGSWAADLIANCLVSQRERAQRGAGYRNLFLQGTLDGSPATYGKTGPYTEDVSSYLYSPIELRFAIGPDDPGQTDERAMAQAAQRALHQELRRGSVDMMIDPAVLWALIKGKTFLQLLWSQNGFEASVIQPELFGVLREDINHLDKQEAFVVSTWVTSSIFEQIVSGHVDEKELLTRVKKYIDPSKPPTEEKQNFLKQVIIGGLNPYKSVDETADTSQGMVQWLNGPYPSFSAQLQADLIRLDTLWVQDVDTEDWTTIQLVGDDVIIEGKHIHRNIFADPSDITDKELLKRSKENNPLAGHIPYIEFCPNELEGYFWGLSELHRVALLQESLNSRINGINSLLRRQENPPRYFSGSGSINQLAYAKLNKPGGFMSDSSGTMKMETLAPVLPPDLWTDKHEVERMFDDVGGFTPILRGRGEAGVRSNAQAAALTRTGSPRFKTRALRTERSVEEVGGLAIDILKARYTKKVVGWAKPGEDLPGAAPPSWWQQLFRAPAKGMQRIEFLMHDLPDSFSCRVDSHSSSPAFSQDAKELAFALRKAEAISNQALIALTHPPHEEQLILDSEADAIAKAEFAAQHPEEAMKKKK